MSYEFYISEFACSNIFVHKTWVEEFPPKTPLKALYFLLPPCDILATGGVLINFQTFCRKKIVEIVVSILCNFERVEYGRKLRVICSGSYFKLHFTASQPRSLAAYKSCIVFIIQMFCFFLTF